MGPRARARGNESVGFGDLSARVASMGPRARARGNRYIQRTDGQPWWLQWGHERALVEIGRRASGGCRYPGLQWGHERALVEMKLHQERYYRSDASMGPRARARGNAGVWETLCQVRRASMGPRARARGNAAGIAELRCKRCGLQWGHERALVEMMFVNAPLTWSVELQWGHERALVEIRPIR